MKYHFKPNDDEYPVFYKGYIDTLEDKDLLPTLRNEKKYALDLFKKIPLEKANYQYQEGKWSVKQVLLHIIDTEMVFSYRALAISRGETQELPGFDQDEYMAEVNVDETTLSELIQCFDHLRSANIILFSMLRKQDLDKIGVASGYSVSARTLGYFISGHCKYHVNILKDRYGV
ncbi:DinB family protein [Portibacter lacus]|uniref:DNA damage-inducible protein DinB n=1 Tax=Portibacter lacus TaxID=1099794 RepID=A0AA37SSP9_9BACT|nr:DinB family protein [Portibacter lacus]GLR18940.1 DNA damage-inducible protein DinB [Portibacter lacus]